MNPKIKWTKQNDMIKTNLETYVYQETHVYLWTCANAHI